MESSISCFIREGFPACPASSPISPTKIEREVKKTKEEPPTNFIPQDSFVEQEGGEVGTCVGGGFNVPV